MKVLIATGLYPPEIGGPATYAAMIEEMLPSCGIETQVFPFGRVRHYPKIVRHIIYTYKLWKGSRKMDIIYALDPISVGLPALIVARLRRKPFLIRLGGDYAWEQGRVRFGLTETLDEYLTKKTPRPLFVTLLAVLQTFVTKRAVSVVAPSQYLKSVIERWGVSKDKIVVIYSALFLASVKEDREQLRTQLSYTNPTIISIARLVPWKGFDALLRVVLTLLKTYPQLTFIIGGDGPEREHLEAETKKLGIQDHVRFTGLLEREALAAAVKAADVFVLNSSYEGLAHQLIEAMHIGTPVVATNIGGNPELIESGVEGFLVPFDDEEAMVDAIKRILDHPETRTRIVQSARGRSKDFSQSVMFGKIEELLKNTYDSTIT